VTKKFDHTVVRSDHRAVGMCAAEITDFPRDCYRTAGKQGKWLVAFRKWLQKKIDVTGTFTPSLGLQFDRYAYMKQAVGRKRRLHFCKLRFTETAGTKTTAVDGNLRDCRG